MKTIGLLGGMSWESTVSYYQQINRQVKTKLGGLHSAELVLHSVDFAPIEKLQHQGNWPQTAEILQNAARSVERGGADFLLICTNTMHKVADDIQQTIDIPLLHIADCTGKALVAKGVNKVGLLGTAFTMEQDFYKGRLSEKFGIEVVTPNEADREVVHRVIYQELCQGKVLQESKTTYQNVVQDLSAQGAQAVIMGCTEIGLLLEQKDCKVPLVDTVKLHVDAAVEYALEGVLP